tara:strand:- start:29 stop:202 length:174 start_codon:yes stop_codon:yes gene_type:complete
MVTTSVLRKVIRVVESTKNREQLQIAKKYINLYYRMYGDKNKWVVESYYKKQSIKLK